MSIADGVPVGRGRRSGLATEAALAATCFVAYLAADVWAKKFSLPGSILIWFPPAGVAIGFCYLRPRLVVVVAVAEVVSTTAIIGLGSEFGVGGLLVNSVGIAASYGLAGWSLRKLRLDPRQRTAEDMLLLYFACLVVGPSLAALVGVSVQGWVGLVKWSDFTRSVGIFWLGDAIGAVCLTPSILLVGSALLGGRVPALADHEPQGWLAYLLVLEYLLPSAVGVALMQIGGEPLRFAYLAFVPVVLIAVRHGIAGAAYSAAVLGAVMSVGAHLQLATTVDRSDFQLLILTLSTTGLIVGAVVSARRDVLAQKARVSEIIEATTDLVASVARDGTVRFLNPAGRQLMGVAEADLVSTRAFDFLPDDLARSLMREGMHLAEQHGSWSGENRLLRPDGRVVPVSQVLVAHRHPGDDDVSFSTVCRDVTDAHRLEDQLRRATLYDDSTGLPNRALLTEQLQHLTGPERWRSPSAVLFCDVDRIDRVNETWGFSAGDALIAAIGGRIQEAVRSGDLVARYGVAQFVVVMTGTEDELELVRLADRLLGCFAEPVTIEGREVRVTGSVGVSLVDIERGPAEALRSAEIALHRAQEAGGGRFTLFDSELEERSRRRIEIAGDLQQVLDTGTWWLAYQPIFDAETRRITSLEALLRWTHPERGPVSPFDLIRQAEHAGTIVGLGREILRRACIQAQTWHRAGYEVGMAVNVSARQLHEPGFVTEVREVVEETGLEPRWLTIELTETLLARNEHGEVATLLALRDLGCCVALDDFGTGYSSLGELHDLPIDVVKMDQAFIRQLDESPRAANLVDAVVRLARSLDLVVVAEGVERESQIATLTDMRCHRLQGYALSRPLEAPALTELLEAEHTGA